MTTDYRQQSREEINARRERVLAARSAARLPTCADCGRSARDGVALVEYRPLTRPVGTVVHLCGDDHAGDCVLAARARGAVGARRDTDRTTQTSQPTG